MMAVQFAYFVRLPVFYFGRRAK